MSESILVFTTGCALFVLPVRGNAELGSLVHLHSANLNLDRPALRTEDGGVEGLIEIEFWCCDVVLEAARHGIPPGMDRAKCRVAVPDRGHQDPDAGQIVNIVEVPASTHHFLVNRIELLRSTAHLCLDLRLAEIVVYSINDTLHVCVTLRRAVLDE